MRTAEKVAFALSALAVAAAARAAETIDHGYDARGRLVRVQHKGSVNNNVTTNYSYDKADNRIIKSVTGGPAQCLLAMPAGGLIPIPIPRCGA